MEKIQDVIEKYGLLVMAFLGFAGYFLYPAFSMELRYFHILCMVLAIFNGRRFIQVQDIKGWFLQNAALLIHAACLIGESILSK